MRTLLLALSLVAAAFAFVPSADAAMQVCAVKVSESCGGFACVDQNGDRRWSDAECVDKRDLQPDTCQFMSDCCGGIGSGLWCPDRE